MDLDEKSLHTLSCDISIRPRNAAGIAELLPFVRTVHTDTDKVIVQFELAGKGAVESFVCAERVCCTALDWELMPAGNELQLTVTGNTEQVSIIKDWFDPN